MSVSHRYRISGMTCQNCVRHVTKALSSLPGVTRVEVSLEHNDATVESGAPIPFDQVRSAVQEAGYGASEDSDPATLLPAGLAEPAPTGPTPLLLDPAPPEPSGLSRTSFRVEGMHCATCVFTIEKVLRRQDGVGRVHVNLATESCDLTFDPRRTSIDRLFSAIRDAGYNPSLPDAEAVKLEYHKELTGLFATTLLGGILLILHGRAGESWILAFSALLQAAGGWIFYRGAWSALRNGTANMDTLVALGTTSALGYTALHVAGFVPDDMVMTQVLLLIFIRAGKVLEAWVKARARSLLMDTASLLPESASVVLPDGSLRTTPLAELTAGVTVLVPHGERLPADGILTDREAWVDLSLVTGESLPVRKSVGEELVGGATNAGSPFRMNVTGLGRETVLFRILSMVQEAQGDRPPVQRLADRISAIFVPAVIGIAILAAALFELSTGDHRLAFMALIGVLVVACPCALGLATPTAILVGSSRALRMGILFRKGQAIEELSRIDILAMDKTGTLTRGTLTDVIWTPATGESSLDRLGGRILEAVRQSGHPVSRALSDYLGQNGILPVEGSQVEEIPGKGLVARWADGIPHRLLVGNLVFLREEGVPLPPPETGESSGVLVGVAENGQLAGTFRLADELRPEAEEVIGRFRRRGVDVRLLTGDRKEEAARVALMARIPEDHVHAQLSPGEKRELIRSWEQQGKTVAMVGDGINDAGSLAQASVGIAMSRAMALTREKGDVLLLGDDLIRLDWAHRAAILTMGKIRQNLGWAFFYNLLGIPLAGGILYPFFHLFVPPYYSGLAMALSSVTVVANALSLSYSIPGGREAHNALPGFREQEPLPAGRVSPTKG